MLASARAAPSVTLRASPAARCAARRGRTTRVRAFGSWKKKQPEAPADAEDGADDAEGAKEPGIDFTGLKQLVSMGLGTISGDITEINLDDPTRTVVMELEANNFEDKDGNPLALRALDNEGFVEEAGEKTPLANVVVPVVLGVGAIAGVVATMNAL
jgi:hypothetical protein